MIVRQLAVGPAAPPRSKAPQRWRRHAALRVTAPRVTAPRVTVLIALVATTAFSVGCAEDTRAVKTVRTAPESPLIALTPTQFNNTVRDLLVLPADVKDWPTMPQIGVAAPLGAAGGIFGSAAVVPAPWPYTFPAEAGVDGFEGMAKGQVPSSYSVEQLQKAARHYGSFVLVSPVFFVCDGKTWATSAAAARDACAHQSLLRFAQRAWRRPLTVAEGDRITGLWDAMKLLGTPEQAVALAASAILQAPGFLFRIERGDASRSDVARKNGVIKAAGGGTALPLSDWEMASRLSYYLWNSMPDSALFAAAAKGELRTQAQIEAQARRLLADPRAQAALVHFHHQWLGTNQLHRVSPARRIYGPLFGIAPLPPLDTTGDGEWPALMNPLRHSLSVETALFVKDALFGTTGANPGTLTALLTSERGYVSQYTAPVYGVGTCDSVNFPGGKTGGKGTGCVIDAQVVNLDPANAVQASVSGVAAVTSNTNFTLHPATFPKRQRAGVFTLPSVLALGAHAVHPSPIKRGKRLLERLACVHFNPPPLGSEAATPADAPTDESTNRERTVAATKPVACSGCHDHLGLNMAGFAFEHYDSFGHWRSKDGGKDVDASGVLKLPGEPALVFKDAVELAQKMAKSPRVQNCYVRQHLRYAAGVEVSDDDATLQALQKTFRGDDRVIELVVAITGTELFRYRKLPSAGAAGGAAP